MPELSVQIDQLSFFLGGYSALGIALYSGSIYEMIPNIGCGGGGIASIYLDTPPHPVDNNNAPGDQDQVQDQGSEPEMTSMSTRLKKYGLILTRFGFVQMRVAERLLVGGSLYHVVNNTFKDYNFPIIVSAFISGGIVGVVEAGVNKDWKKLLTFGGGAAAFSCGMETLISLLQSGGVMGGRPTFKFIYGGFDPLLFLVGAWGSHVFGVWSLSIFDDLYFPPVPGPGDDIWGMWRFLKSCLLNRLALEMRAEERVFVGGCLAWGVQGLLKQVGIQHRLMTSMAVGVTLGAYWCTYGKRVRRDGWIWMGGMTLLSILSELLITPNVSQDYLWELVIPSQGKQEGSGGFETKEFIFNDI